MSSLYTNLENRDAQSLLRIIASYGRERSFSLRQTVYREGENPKGFYYLISGLVGLHKLSPNGKQRLLRVYSEHSFFGYRSLLGQDPYYGSAIVLKPCNVLFFPFDKITELEKKVPDVFRYFSSFLSTELKDAELRIFRSSSVKMKDRVIDSLLYLQNYHGNYDWTYREVGEFCGGETETIIRICNQLKQVGALKKESRHWRIVDERKLLSLKENG
ncbi:Crp/Fnr family transcriptional regulator [Endozoicomonas elysicola]|uniref:Crp/Fnr family transcriptional regulator n=1 Tax=Endozoicomonas elysicola TaxID=305900 RepID=UPI000374020B|nr:Crp/Fnr family transcriptional regulator [Endozoicomonas elysicola]